LHDALPILVSLPASFRSRATITGSWRRQRDWGRLWSHDPDRDRCHLHLRARVAAVSPSGRGTADERGRRTRGRHADRLAWHVLLGRRARARSRAHSGALRAAGRDAARQPALKDLALIARHPDFDVNAALRHRVTADVALIKLAAPLKVVPALLAPAGGSVVVGDRFVVAGYGVAVHGDGKAGGRVAAAAPVAARP